MNKILRYLQRTLSKRPRRTTAERRRLFVVEKLERRLALSGVPGIAAMESPASEEVAEGGFVALSSDAGTTAEFSGMFRLDPSGTWIDGSIVGWSRDSVSSNQFALDGSLVSFDATLNGIDLFDSLSGFGTINHGNDLNETVGQIIPIPAPELEPQEQEGGPVQLTGFLRPMNSGIDRSDSEFVDEHHAEQTTGGRSLKKMPPVEISVEQGRDRAFEVAEIEEDFHDSIEETPGTLNSADVEADLAETAFESSTDLSAWHRFSLTESSVNVRQPTTASDSETPLEQSLREKAEEHATERSVVRATSQAFSWTGGTSDANMKKLENSPPRDDHDELSDRVFDEWEEEHFGIQVPGDKLRTERVDNRHQTWPLVVLFAAGHWAIRYHQRTEAQLQGHPQPAQRRQL